MARSEVVQVRVDADLLKKIDRLCEKLHQTRSTLGEIAFEQLVGERSDLLATDEETEK